MTECLARPFPETASACHVQLSTITFSINPASGSTPRRASENEQRAWLPTFLAVIISDVLVHATAMSAPQHDLFDASQARTETPSRRTSVARMPHRVS